MSSPPQRPTIEDLVPGGILQSDTQHRWVTGSVCSRCGGEIGDDDVPLEVYSADAVTMWLYCDACIAAGVPDQAKH